MTESLLESELFGHKRGAFTDARDNRAGLLVQARGGTVFLDEIGDMPPGMQAKLLRAIESRTVRPVGSDTEIPIDVRFVAATNRDLESDAEEGRFRHDLFFRINVIQIPVPGAAGAGQRHPAAGPALPRAGGSPQRQGRGRVLPSRRPSGC